SPGSVQRPHPPILIGGLSNAALRRVVRHGNGWLAVSAPPEKLRERLVMLEQLTAEAGRRLQDFSLVYKAFLSIGEAKRGPFVARGAHLAAMRARGLRVLGPRGDVHLNPTQATDQPASIGPVDFVLFCVKLWDVESAGAAIRPLVGANTAVIPLQNGIDASDRL